MKKASHTGMGVGVTGIAALIVCAAGLTTAEACAVCYGDPNSQLTQAMGPGILVLLGCIGSLLGIFGGVFCYWALRMKRLGGPVTE